MITNIIKIKSKMDIQQTTAMIDIVLALHKLIKQGSHIYWKTWKNESTPGKPGKIMEFCKK